jgi:hypothetical protein
MYIKNIILMFSLVILSLPNIRFIDSGSLSAKELIEERVFKKGRLFVDLGIASGTSIGPDSNFGSSGDAFFYLIQSANSPNQNIRNISLFGFADSISKKPDVTGENFRLGFEYGFTEWLGLGGSVSNTSVTWNNPTLGTEFPFLVLLPLISGNTPLSETLLSLSLAPNTIKFENLPTSDFDVSFHVPTRIGLDPYSRITVGIGSTRSGGFITKVGAAFGVRYNFHENYTASVEGLYNSYSVDYEDGFAPAIVDEYGIRFSVGLFLEAP